MVRWMSLLETIGDQAEAPVSRSSWPHSAKARIRPSGASSRVLPASFGHVYLPGPGIYQIHQIAPPE